jgi:hypothetical protein
MSALLLHITDIHIKTPKDPILKRAKDIAACTYSSLPSASHIFVVVSGDIAYSGEASQYELATNFFEAIRDSISEETSSPITFIVVPGNHDCDFSLNNSTRNMLVKSIEESENPDIDSSVVKACTSIQVAFFDFREKLEANPEADDDRLWRTSRFEVEGKTLTFECLNISWVSKIREEPGRLYFPIKHYISKQSDDADVRFVVLHHPLNWFNQSIYRSFRKFIRQLANIVISGHEHQGNVGIILDAETEKSTFVEGCVLQGKQDLSDSSFNLVILDLDSSQFASTRYNWTGKRYEASEEGSWSDYHNLPALRKNPFTIANSFQEILDDPGGFFRHPGRVNITLSDLFVYPDLRKVGDTDDRRKDLINSSKLIAPEVTDEGILIEGEEKAGCTSLLYQLYRQYHDRGFVPLLIKGKELRKTTDNEIDAVIRRAVEEQYGKSQVVGFQQLSSSQKLLLLDDFDDGPTKAANARAGLLCTLRKRFGHVVVTVSEIFEMKEMLDGDASRELLSLEHYQIQPFGYTLRSQLIERWFSLGADGTVDEAAFISRCDQAERLVNAVMRRTVIPSIPLYLLTLLQSMEAGRSGDFRESALGYYYQFLLTEAFQECGVKPDKLTEMFQYSSHLAWEFHIQQKRELSDAELREFNTKFSSIWHTVDFLPRIEVLIKARVLRLVGDEYAFRYPYIYYYLKGQYLSNNLSDIQTRNYIIHCCNHLYVREHANTVLFLAHHTNDDFVLNTISEALHRLFVSYTPVDFNGDSTEIAKLIEEAPQLKYSGERPTDHRKRRNAIQDELDDGNDGLVETEEKSSELSLAAQITMLFKTTEILGQVLKNQYAKIPRNRKSDLLTELFNGPLRALNNFYDFFRKNPDSLVAEIEATIQRKGKSKKDDERKSIARKVVASIIQVITFSFVMKAAQGANSDSLLEDVRNVVNKNDNLAFKLIELCILLDSPKPIPKSKLKQLYIESKKDVIAERLLKIMVLHRLYMFKTPEQDIQWLTSELKLDIADQHVIAYGSETKKMRRLK